MKVHIASYYWSQTTTVRRKTVCEKYENTITQKKFAFKAILGALM